ncbi:MAG: CvpA family protein [Planctomycetaceae bacterium]|nr:CvpA family protein [Planctomycetaceae bacterium]
MQVYDIIILILVGWLTLRGAMKGMISQLASIAAVIASFWAAVRFGPVLEPIMQSTFNAKPPWDKVLGITLAFVGASIAVMFLHRVLLKIISVIRMRKFDRLCGAMFGFLKGVLIGMILTFFAVMLSEQTRTLATQSRCGQILVLLIQRTQSLLPEDVSTLIEANLEGFRKQLESSTDAAEGKILQVKAVSKAATDIKNVIESLGSMTSLTSEWFSGGFDPANEQPILSSETATITPTLPRDYPSPEILTLQRPATPGTEVNLSGATSNVPLVEATSAIPIVAISAAIQSGNAAHPTAASVISPSAELLPITSTTSMPTFPNSETGWRTLLREMR